MKLDLLRAFVDSLYPVPAPDFALLAPHLTARRVPKGAHLLEAGQVCDAIYFVNAGFFRMYYAGADGHDVNCRFAGANGFLTNFQSFLTQQPSRYTWQALQPAEVLVLPYLLVQRLYRESAAWDHFGRLMAERVYQQVNERVELLQFLTPTQRYQYVQQHHPELLTQELTGLAGQAAGVAAEQVVFEEKVRGALLAVGAGIVKAVAPVEQQCQLGAAIAGLHEMRPQAKWRRRRAAASGCQSAFLNAGTKRSRGLVLPQNRGPTLFGRNLRGSRLLFVFLGGQAVLQLKQPGKMAQIGET